MIERSPDVPESGKVQIDWQINSEGKVFEAGVVRDDFSNKEFQKCLVININRIVFPVPNGLFVTVRREGILLTSSDGISWDIRTSGTTNTLYGVTYKE